MCVPSRYCNLWYHTEVFPAVRCAGFPPQEHLDHLATGGLIDLELYASRNKEVMKEANRRAYGSKTFFEIASRT